MKSENLKFIRRAAWAASAVILAALTLFAIFGPRPATDPVANVGAAASDIGGPFRLVDHNGAVRTEADFLGDATVIYFGFATCPDICPAALGKLAGALEVLGEDADRLDALFITVDPERDTPEMLKTYLAFEPRLTGLSGPAEDVDATLDAFRVYRRRVELPDSALGYTMDHSSLYYVLDEKGAFIAPIRDTLSVEEIAVELRKYI